MSAIRRMMMGKGGDDYISNGLVFHLDGIKKGTAEPDKWVDLVGGLIFTNDGAVSGTNCWQFNNTTSTYYVLKNTDTLTFSSNTHTIEICFDSTLNRGVLFSPKTSGIIAFGFDTSNNIVWNTAVLKAVWKGGVTLTGAHTISIADNRALRDYSAELQQSTRTDYWGAGAYNGIGGRSTNANYQFNGKIYAIRIYNRQLSLDEMKHNQKVDNKRFNLGLNI